MGTVDDWIDACRRQGIRLRRRGREHCGPSPICQTGDDRFRIKPGHVQPVLARCRQGHTYRQLHRMLPGDSFDTPIPPRPPAAATEPANPTRTTQARNARRLFAAAHCSQPTYFRRNVPQSDRLVWTYRDMWLVPLKPFAQGQLLAGIAGARFILPPAANASSAASASPDSQPPPAGAGRGRSCSPKASPPPSRSRSPSTTRPWRPWPASPQTDSSESQDGWASAAPPSSQTTTTRTRTASAPA